MMVLKETKLEPFTDVTATVCLHRHTASACSVKHDAIPVQTAVPAMLSISATYEHANHICRLSMLHQ